MRFSALDTGDRALFEATGDLGEAELLGEEELGRTNDEFISLYIPKQNIVCMQTYVRVYAG